ncbi:topless-related protein 4-like protein [Tanacetum coccineum]
MLTELAVVNLNDFEKLPLYNSPKKGDVIAYRVLELTSFCTPELTSFGYASTTMTVAPCIRFNKEGIIMVVSTKENGITILANPNEIGLLQTMEICRSFNQSRVEGLIPIDIITMMMTVSDMEAGFDGIMREEKHRCFVPRSCFGKRVTLARELMEDEAEQFLLHDDMMMPTGQSRMSLKNHR